MQIEESRFTGPNDREPRSEAEQFEALIDQLYWQLPEDTDDDDDDENETDKK